MDSKLTQPMCGPHEFKHAVVKVAFFGIKSINGINVDNLMTYVQKRTQLRLPVVSNVGEK